MPDDLNERIAKVEKDVEYSRSTSHRLDKIEGERKIAIGVFTIAIVASGVFAYLLDSVQNTITDLNDNLSDIESNYTKLQTNITGIENETNTLDKQVNNLQNITSDQQGRLRSIGDIQAERVNSVGDNAVSNIIRERDASTENIRRDAVSFIQRRLVTETSKFEVPAGAVLAFDSRTGCPSGWSLFSEASGRMIVGVGKKVGVQGSYELLYGSTGPRYDTGGAETHTLTVEEMPEHVHPNASLETIQVAGHFQGHPAITVPGRDSNTAYEINLVGSAGGGQPHNNMPPYIALYFCKKEG